MANGAAIDFSQYADKPAPTIDFSGYADKAPAQPTPASDGYQPGAGNAIWEDIKGVAKSLPSLFPPIQAMNAVQQGVDQYRSLRDTGQTLEQRQNADQKARGYGTVYRLVTPAAQSLGVNVSGMEQSAAHGDEAGVYGHAVVPTTMAVAPLAGELALKTANRVIPSRPRAGVGIRTLTERNAAIRPRVGESYRIAREITDSANMTGASIPEPIRAYADRILAEPHDGGSPITFHEMQEFKKALADTGDPSARAIAGHIGAEQQAAANAAGFGKDWRAQANEYRRGSKIVRGAEKAGPFIGAAAGMGAASAAEALGLPIPKILTTVAPGLAEGAGALLGYTTGKSALGSVARAIIDRDAGAPRLSKPAAPAVPRVSPKLVTPEVPESGTPSVAPEAPAPVAAPTPERRVNIAQRDRVEHMTPDERAQALLTDFKTGLPNERGFHEAAPVPAYGFSDVAGLKWLNDNYGNAGGDILLKMKAQALREAGVDASRIGGDEFGHRGQELTDLHQRLTKANDIFNKMILKVRDPKTGLIDNYDQMSFRFGVGPDIETANQGMLRQKAIDQSRGKQGKLRKLPSPPEAIAQQATGTTGKPATPESHIRLSVSGNERTVPVNDAQSQQLSQAQAAYDQRVAWAKKTFANDPESRAARIKGAGMEFAAEKRRITGQLTGKEAAKQKAYDTSNHVGKSVTVKGQTGKITGMSFGRVRVKLADGTMATVNPEDLQ